MFAKLVTIYNIKELSFDLRGKSSLECSKNSAHAKHMCHKPRFHLWFENANGLAPVSKMQQTAFFQFLKTRLKAFSNKTAAFFCTTMRQSKQLPHQH